MHHSHTHSTHTHDNLETSGAVIRWAFVYDILVNAIMFGQERKLRQATVKQARIQPGESVLDVGCGTGTLAIAVKRESGTTTRVYGTDAASEMIERARQKAARAGVAVDFQPGLVEAIAFPDNTFDVVLSSLMLHHLPGDLKAKAFAEIFRVLKPGGRLLVVDFEPPRGGLKKTILTALLGPGMMQIDNRTVPPLLTAAGFVNVELGSTGVSMASYIAGVKPITA